MDNEWDESVGGSSTSMITAAPKRTSQILYDNIDNDAVVENDDTDNKEGKEVNEGIEGEVFQGINPMLSTDTGIGSRPGGLHPDERRRSSQDIRARTTPLSRSGSGTKSRSGSQVAPLPFYASCASLLVMQLLCPVIRNPLQWAVARPRKDIESGLYLSDSTV